jgi:hypothetical protein
MSGITKDPDNSYDDDVVFSLEIKVRRSGAMSVAGGINATEYALQVLDSAKDSIRNHKLRQAIENGGLTVPAHDAPKLILPGS